jgi:hypothetical protein
MTAAADEAVVSETRRRRLCDRHGSEHAVRRCRLSIAICASHAADARWNSAAVRARILIELLRFGIDAIGADRSLPMLKRLRADAAKIELLPAAADGYRQAGIIRPVPHDPAAAS